jgi:hypothetical protein
MNAVLSKKSVPASPQTFFGGTTGTSNGTVMFTGAGTNADSSNWSHSSKSVEAAVFSYLQARRALGVLQISSIEIAGALGLAQSIVEIAMRKLSGRGVKVK